MSTMTEHSAKTGRALSARQVAEYLQDHPEFFVDNRALLAELHLPHDSGSAVSLVERQISVLRDRNVDMRRRMSKLLDNARDNDKLFEHSKRLVLQLLEGEDAGDIIDALYYSFEKEFDIQYVSLLLFGRQATLPSTQARVVNETEARECLSALLKNQRALCGSLSEKESRFIFGQAADEIGSAATVPLVHGRTFGLLAVGNRDPHHYRSSVGTLFLGYIGEVLNRLLPRHLGQ